MSEKKILNEKERIERNKQIAESYYKVYSKKLQKMALFMKNGFMPQMQLIGLLILVIIK